MPSLFMLHGTCPGLMFGQCHTLVMSPFSDCRCLSTFFAHFFLDPDFFRPLRPLDIVSRITPPSDTEQHSEPPDDREQSSNV